MTSSTTTTTTTHRVSSIRRVDGDTSWFTLSFASALADLLVVEEIR